MSDLQDIDIAADGKTATLSAGVYIELLLQALAKRGKVAGMTITALGL